jgi:hypothetical protein
MAQRQLKSQGDVRRTLAWVFRQIESDEMPVLKGRVLIYALMSLSSVMSEHELEARIQALETERETR